MGLGLQGFHHRPVGELQLREQWSRRGGLLFFHLNGPDIGPIFLAQTEFLPTPGTGYSLAVTKDSSGTYIMWIDGVPARAAEQTDTTPIPQPSVPLTIGQAEGLGSF